MPLKYHFLAYFFLNYLKTNFCDKSSVFEDQSSQVIDFSHAIPLKIIKSVCIQNQYKIQNI